ncbi:MAG: hypothetical protein ACLSVK_04080, partial [Acutalibacteraceae bacterium]
SAWFGTKMPQVQVLSPRPSKRAGLMLSGSGAFFSKRHPYVWSIYFEKEWFPMKFCIDTAPCKV